MVTTDDARSLAREALAAYAATLGEPLELVGAPEEMPRCLVFYWARSSGSPAAPGVGPIAVETSTGRTCFLGSQPLAIAVEVAGLA